MYELELGPVRRSLVKAVRVIVAARAFVRPLGIEYPEFEELEREFREQAGEVQKAERMLRNGDPVMLARA